MFWFFLFIISFGLSWLLANIIRLIALHYSILDYPNDDRKRHTRATPLLGGVAIFLTLIIILYINRSILLSGNLENHHWLGVLIASIVLIIGGILDDIKKYPPLIQFIFPVVAAIIVVLSGIGIEKITAPSGGYLYLNTIAWPLFSWQGSIVYFHLIADTFTILWLLGMTYTTKLLDGIDGLVSSVVAVGAFVIFLFTTTTRWAQPDIAFAALMLCGACFGFLVLNWSPAKIFLGEAGALFLGFFLGIISIISGGKIAIALLIMGIPVLDVVWTIIRRLLQGKNPFRFADRKHLHFRLLDAGLSQKQTVVAFCLTSFIFGLSALFFQSKGKIYTLAILLCVMIVVIAVFNWLDKKRILP